MLRMENLEKVYRTDYIETHALNQFNLLLIKGAVPGPAGGDVYIRPAVKA